MSIYSCNYHHNQNKEQFHNTKKYSLMLPFLDLTPTHPSIPCNHWSVLRQQSFAFFRWNCTVCKLSGLSYYTHDNAFEMHPCCCIYQQGFPFIVEQYCMGIPQLTHLPVQGHLSCFQFFAIMNRSSINICVEGFVEGKCQFSFLLGMGKL